MLRYIYFGQKKDNSAHAGVTCIGYEFTEEGKAVNMAFAFCSPNDRFSKKKAHLIISGRVNKQDTIKLNGITEQTRYEKIVLLAKEALNDVMPKGVANVHEYVMAHKHEAVPTIADTKLPWWFSGIEG
jgi:hypothetical protein